MIKATHLFVPFVKIYENQKNIYILISLFHSVALICHAKHTAFTRGRVLAIC